MNDRTQELFTVLKNLVDKFDEIGMWRLYHMNHGKQPLYGDELNTARDLIEKIENENSGRGAIGSAAVS